ncbi:MAG: MnmC family methyltransferase [Verrucomicrobia bacterium]|jgi:tRNA U34 5-methylaminomethyl-2-thiouridine-forming methyltransferase MnmC|nr:MnmC family methyltransferase [Verrucomicrobiota bacterium]
MAAEYQLVRLANGVTSVRSIARGETFHPVIGPAAEAEALYVRQLRLPQRLTACAGEFVLWDVGLGAGGNVLTALAALRDIPRQLRVVSFDETLAPLQFAVAHARELGYFGGLEETAAWMAGGAKRQAFRLGRLEVEWEVHLGDFPMLLTRDSKSLPAPHAIMYDAYSPMRNAAMWTLPLFERLYRCLDPQRPCALPTYSRSTILRVTLLLAGFYVGVGRATGEKEETTLAANTLDLIEEPLGRDWLDRALRSHSAEPLWQPRWRVSPLSLPSRDRLRRHPQFVRGQGGGSV